MAGQIEYWARVGRAIEPLLEGDKALALRKSGDLRPLSELLSRVDSPAGRQRVADYLGRQQQLTPREHQVLPLGGPGLTGTSAPLADSFT